MSVKKSISDLKASFKKGMYPTESAFWDLIDSFCHKQEEKIPISDVDTLAERLDEKFERSDAQPIVGRIETVSEAFVPISDQINSKQLSIDALYDADNLFEDDMVAGDSAALEAAKGYSDQKPHLTDDEKAAWNAKQDPLVSGATIKTINGSPALGAGDVEIVAGPSTDLYATLQTGMSISTAGAWSKDERLKFSGDRTIELLFTTGSDLHGIYGTLYSQSNGHLNIVFYGHIVHIMLSSGHVELLVIPDTTYHIQVDFGIEYDEYILYVNGVLIENAGHTPYVPDDIMVGGNVTNEPFMGVLHFLRIYNKMVDNAILYNERKLLRHDPAAFVEYLPVNLVAADGSVVTSWKDSGPNGIDLAIVGLPTVSFAEPINMDRLVINTDIFYKNLSPTVREIIPVPSGYRVEDIIIRSYNSASITLTAVQSGLALIPPTPVTSDYLISMGNDATTTSAFTALGRSTSIYQGEVVIYSPAAITNSSGIKVAVILRRIPFPSIN